MQCAPYSRVRIILGYVLYKYALVPSYKTCLHKYNSVNGEENVINFTPCKCSDVPENRHNRKKASSAITRILFCTLSIP